MQVNKTINTEGNESNSFISKNEDFHIFFADYKTGFGGTDLYINLKRKIYGVTL